MLLASTSSRHTIPYPETNCGNTYAAVTCLTIYSPSSKTCITQMSTHCWMGTSKQVCSQSLVWSNAVPSPPCFFPFTFMMLTVWLKGYRAHLLVFQILLSHNCCLLTTSFCCPMSMTSCRPCSTSSEYMFTRDLWRWTHKSEVMCFNSRSDNRSPPLYYDGTQLSYTDTFKYLGMVCDKNIILTTAADAALRPFTTGTFRVKNL